ncbi:MAG: 3-deoxy-manno-octulosonate cytidylyltransferase [Armatimonadetes bacterium]|nr:3-deoxy-manno-octulosonate cytidylyltransferase [Armatimonadota bacterium]
MGRTGIVAIIPARMRSSRFPGKPLANILGLPMVEHVRRRARLCRLVDDVIVATCDGEIYEAVTAAGGRAVMTSSAHERGTDRVEEAARDVDAEVVINVQADMPLLQPETLAEVARPLVNSDDADCTNLVAALSGPGDLQDTSIVKVFVDQRHGILTFSRRVAPYTQVDASYPVYRQQGVYGFRKIFLHQYARMAPTPLERVESVDMFRVLEHGRRIRAVVGSRPLIEVDHLEDIARVEAVLCEDPTQRALHARIVAP